MSWGAVGRGLLPLLLVAAGAVALQACGDPIVVLGDLPGIMRVVLGVAPDQDGASGPPAVRVQLAGPRGVAAGTGGMLYVLDPPVRTLFEVSTAGEVRTVVDRDGCDGAACLVRPEALSLDGRGGALLADPGAGRVWHVDLATGTVTVLAGKPGGEEARPGANATDVALQEPAGVAAAPDGSVYFTERNAHRIWRVERGGTLSAVAGNGLGYLDGPAANARFRTPSGLALSGSALFVADQGNHRVRAVDLENATVSTLAGSGTPAYGGDEGPAVGASLSSPEAVAVSADGISLFVADKGNHRVRRVNLATGTITTFVGTGIGKFTGSGLEAGVTGLAAPSGVAVMSASFLFVADTGNGLVWRTPVG